MLTSFAKPEGAGAAWLALPLFTGRLDGLVGSSEMFGLFVSLPDKYSFLGFSWFPTLRWDLSWFLDDAQLFLISSSPASATSYFRSALIHFPCGGAQPQYIQSIPKMLQSLTLTSPSSQATSSSRSRCKGGGHI